MPQGLTQFQEQTPEVVKVVKINPQDRVLEQIVDLTALKVAESSSERIVAQTTDLPVPQVAKNAPERRKKKNRKKPVVEYEDAEYLIHDPQWRALMSSIAEVSGWEPDADVVMGCSS